MNESLQKSKEVVYQEPTQESFDVPQKATGYVLTGSGATISASNTDFELSSPSTYHTGQVNQSWPQRTTVNNNDLEMRKAAIYNTIQWARVKTLNSGEVQADEFMAQLERFYTFLQTGQI